MIRPIVQSWRRRRAALLFLLAQICFGQIVVTHTLLIGGMFNSLFRVHGLDLQGSFAVVSEDDDPGLGGRDVPALAALPGVREAAFIWRLPFQQEAMPDLMTAADGKLSMFWPVYGGPAVARALGIDLIEGRWLTEADAAALEPRPVLVTPTFAQTVFGSVSALGRTFRSRSTGKDLLVVGLLRDASVMAEMDHAAQNVVVSLERPPAARHLEYVVRVDAAERAAFPARAEAALRNLAPGRYLRIETLESLQQARQSAGRGTFVLLGAIILIVLGVALLGSLAMASFLVTERLREIAVRRALGATRQDILRDFLFENFAITTLGIAAGTATALLLNRLVVLRLLSFATLDFWHLLLGMLLFWGTGLLAASIPAVRAARVPPWVASRTV